MNSYRHALGALAVATLVCGSPAAAQTEPDDSLDPTWRQYEGVVLATVTAGCFEIRHQSTWSADSIRYPERFELTSRELTGLGYHRMGTFETDIPALEEGGVPPVWRPVSLEVVTIDPDPAARGDPGYEASLRRTSADGDFVLETHWLALRPLPGTDVARGRLVSRAYGSAVECDQPEGAEEK